MLDNIDSPAQATDCLPRTGNGRVLVTSRNREVRQFAPAWSRPTRGAVRRFCYKTSTSTRLYGSLVGAVSLIVTEVPAVGVGAVVDCTQ